MVLNKEMSMKTFVWAVAAVAAVAVFGAGCEKKQVVGDEQEPMSMAALSTLANETAAAKTQSATSQVSGASVVNATQASVTTAATIKPEVPLEPLPPSGPYKPTVQEVQNALKNAGLYAGEVDGKSGAKTKAAIEAFQKANNLKVDGKVGPQTWAALSAYAASASAETPVVVEKKSKKKH